LRADHAGSTPEPPDPLAREVLAVVRDVPDFPKPGVLFKDITPLLLDAELFARTTQAMARPFAHERVSHVVAIESRGFLLGAPVAQHLHAALVPLRKPGKLPATRAREEYALEYGVDALEVHADAFGSSARVLVVDDVLATGGTSAAACRLVERTGGRVVGISFLLVLEFLHGRSALREWASGIHTIARVGTAAQAGDAGSNAPR
jgi:adenine phosphoribosyltransferase